jgi:hypothetical protein
MPCCNWCPCRLERLQEQRTAETERTIGAARTSAEELEAIGAAKAKHLGEKEQVQAALQVRLLCIGRTGDRECIHGRALRLGAGAHRPTD